MGLVEEIILRFVSPLRLQHLDGLADFLDGCNTFGESLPSAVSSTWKFSYLEGASNQAYGDPMVCRQKRVHLARFFRVACARGDFSPFFHITTSL